MKVNTANEKEMDPVSTEEALASPEQSKWLKAMENEMQSLKDNDVWELVELPQGRKAVGSKWAYKVKTGADGSIEHYKARLVVQGFSQKYGTEYDETFYPVVQLDSLRPLTALAVQHDSKLHQVDVTTAFINGELEEEVYMKQPKGFILKDKRTSCLQTQEKNLWTEAVPQCWNAALDNQLKKMGFVQSASDPCIYVDAGGEVFYIGIYVDDIILAGKSDKKIKEVKETLEKKFDIKDMGKLHYFLGMKVLQNEKNGNVWIGQPAYSDTCFRLVEVLLLGRARNSHVLHCPLQKQNIWL